MPHRNQVDCFYLNMMYWKFLGIYPDGSNWKYYRYYSLFMICTFAVVYVGLCSINLFFLPRHLDIFIEEMIFFFTLIAASSKAITFYWMKPEINKILQELDIDIFHPHTDNESQIIEAATKFNKTYWKIVAVVSYTSNLTHILSPLIAHIIFSAELELPVCSYSFLSENFKSTFIYPLYFYQSFGMHIIMLCNVNIDTFFLGLMILVIAQLDILDEILISIVPYVVLSSEITSSTVNENEVNMKLNKSVSHYDKVAK